MKTACIHKYIRSSPFPGYISLLFRQPLDRLAVLQTEDLGVVGLDFAQLVHELQLMDANVAGSVTGGLSDKKSTSLANSRQSQCCPCFYEVLPVWRNSDASDSIPLVEDSGFLLRRNKMRQRLGTLKAHEVRKTSELSDLSHGSFLLPVGDRVI